MNHSVSSLYDFTISEDQLLMLRSCCPGSNCAVKPKLRYHSGSITNAALRSCCPGSNYAVKSIHPPTSLHAPKWNSSTYFLSSFKIYMSGLQ